MRFTTLLAAFAMLYVCSAGGQAPDITEAEIRAEYDRWAALVAEKGEQEYQVRHILVPTEAQARAALARISDGEPFTIVAIEMSHDPGSRKKGGELGWNLPQTFVEEFSRTMTSLAPRGLARAPTRTRFGWHVIEVTAVRPVTVPPYEQVRDRIAADLRQKTLKTP